jgi:hypothetical protein
MNHITLDISCSCGNKSTRTVTSIIKPDEAKFNINATYNTSHADVIKALSVICVACGTRLELMELGPRHAHH